MNKRQDAKLNMLMTVSEFLLSNKTITSALPNFTENFNTISVVITQLHDFGEQQITSKKGVAETKQQLRQILTVVLLDNSRKLCAYANINNNKILLAEVGLSETNVRSLTTIKIKDYAQNVYDKAQTNISELTEYGITEQTQQKFKDSIDNFNNYISKPGMARVEKTQVTKQIIACLNSGEEALKKIDAVIEIIRQTQVNFYNGYKSARRISQVLGGNLDAIIKVVAQDTGEPLKNTNITIVEENPETQKPNDTKNAILVTKTAEKGSTHIKNIKQGVYWAIATRPGYITKQERFAIVDGETTELKITLTPS